MKTNSLIILFLFFTFCSFAQKDNDAICITPSKEDVSLYKQRMDTFNEYIFGIYGLYYPEDEDFFLYRMLFYAHYDDYKYFHGTLLDLAGKKLGLKNNPISFSLFEYVARDNVYQNVVIHHKLSRMERYPEEHWRWENIYTKDVHTYKNLPPLPASSSLDSMKIKIIDNIDIKTYNNYIANYPDDNDRLVLTLYMMFATRCEQSYNVMSDYITAKYEYRNPELVSRVISELTMQKERLGPYYLELLQDEYLCEDTAKHAQVNKYIFQRMAFEFTDDFFREYMFQTDEVKQQFIWEVSHPMAEGYDIQACLKNIENSTVLSENEKHRLMKAIDRCVALSFVNAKANDVPRQNEDDTLRCGIYTALDYCQEKQSKVVHFNTIDPKADQYPGINPYLYCAGNPIMYVDPTGMKFDEESAKIASKDKYQLLSQMRHCYAELDNQ